VVGDLGSVGDRGSVFISSFNSCLLSLVLPLCSTEELALSLDDLLLGAKKLLLRDVKPSLL